MLQEVSIDASHDDGSGTGAGEPEGDHYSDRPPVQYAPLEVIAGGDQGPGGTVHLVGSNCYRQGEALGEPGRRGEHGGAGVAHGAEQRGEESEGKDDQYLHVRAFHSLVCAECTPVGRIISNTYSVRGGDFFSVLPRVGA